MNTNTILVEQMAQSPLFREYEQAFNMATGMPMALRPVESLALPLRGCRGENTFCAMMARKSESCSSCLIAQKKLRESAHDKAATTTCAYGLSEAAVPVRLGDTLIGFLRTGQVFTEKPSARKVGAAVSRACSLDSGQAPNAVKAAYLQTPVVAREKFQSMVRLLASFAELLSVKSNQIAVAESHSEHPIVLKAKKVVEDRHADEITLGEVAREVHVSPFHLCKLFRRSTGMTFTEFVSRTRTEKAKNLLLNPQLRISEIAFEVGFQSLTHFNRIFRKLVGESPTRFRERSGAGEPAQPSTPSRRDSSRMRLVSQFA